MPRRPRFDAEGPSRRTTSSPAPKLLLLIAFATAIVSVYTCVIQFVAKTEKVQLSLSDSIPRSLGVDGPSLFSLTGPFGNPFSYNVKNPGRFKPFSCSGLVRQLKTNTCPVEDPNLGKIYARMTNTNPNFWISLHNETFDPPRWSIMQFGYYYERELTNAFQKVLRDAPPGTRVIDVGGNIGFFSLVSASMGAVAVDTFEPNIKNRMRLCESLAMNRWYQGEFDDAAFDSQTPVVNLYKYGIGKEEGKFIFNQHIKNPGMGSFEMEQKADDSANSLDVITLDSFAKERNWFETKPDIAILKVDVEGLEYAVIEGAKELLKAGLVRNIFMEVSVRTPAETESNRPFIELLTSTGYKLYQTGSWLGPNEVVFWPNDGNLADKIFEKARQELAKQLNLWWTIRSDQHRSLEKSN